MKLLKTLTLTAVVALLGGLLTNAIAEDAKPAPKAHGAGRGPALEHLLPQPALDKLKLTAEQQTTYNSLEESFRKDADKWRAENPVDKDAIKKAHETGDKEALKAMEEKRKGLMEIRKGYVEKLKATLTAEQKAELETAPARPRAKKGGADAKPAAPAPAPGQ